MKQFILLSIMILVNETLSYGQAYIHDWKQAQQNLQYQEQQEIQAIQAQRANARQKAQICISQIKNQYMSLTQYPTVSDGWHQVYATDNDMMCEVRKVYVSNGKVTRYVRLDDTELRVLMSGAISNAKSMISITGSDNNTYLIDLYFLE